MARKTAQFVVTDEGRDKGKTFVITEMPAENGESWATRALLGLMSAGIELPENYKQLGMAALAEMGLKALPQIRWEMLEPLLKEMFSCVQFVADPRKAYATTRPLLEGGDGDIQEIMTRLKIRGEWWNLHMGFLEAVAPFLLENHKATAGRQSGTKT